MVCDSLFFEIACFDDPSFVVASVYVTLTQVSCPNSILSSDLHRLRDCTPDGDGGGSLSGCIDEYAVGEGSRFGGNVSYGGDDDNDDNDDDDDDDDVVVASFDEIDDDDGDVNSNCHFRHQHSPFGLLNRASAAAASVAVNLHQSAGTRDA